MLYIFQVETGQNFTFDMNLALDSVSSLKNAIWKELKIPIDRQVLLVSGGECLDPTSRVGNYAAGTDTNPIFLFNKSNIESSPTSSGHHNAPSPTDILSDVDNIKDQIEGCLHLPSTYITVVTRAQLAQQLWEMAKDLTHKTEQLIHDQHLQHQGWAAVVANLEDLISAFKSRTSLFEQSYTSYLSEKEERSRILNCFEKDIEQLDSIKIIPTLLSPAECPADSENVTSLKDWIISLDSTNKLESLIENSFRHLEKLDANILDTLQKEAMGIMEKAGLSSMKEIKGLESRLFGLDGLLTESRKLVQEQYDLAQAFLQNQNRASDLKDNSILPDLCQSHQHQLLVMSKNHQQLEDIRRRCSKAKDELSGNLNTRLKWVMFIQRSISDSSNKITVYQESLRRLKYHIDIIEQIHSAANLYAAAVSEVARRKKFSESYGQWANGLADRMEKIHSDEMNHRTEFASKFDGHFLTLLFPGLNDYPTPFATQKPTPFDMNLPKISLEEVENLKKIFPTTSFEEDQIDFSIEFPVTRSDDSSSKSDEHLSLKLELEKVKTEYEEMVKVFDAIKEEHKEKSESLANEKSQEIEKLENSIKKVQEDLENKNARIITLENSSSEMENRLKLSKDELKNSESSLEKQKVEYEFKINKMVCSFEEEKSFIIKSLESEKDLYLKKLNDKYKQDVEGLKMRFKLMSTTAVDCQSQKSPTGENSNSEKTFDSLERSNSISSSNNNRNDEILQDLTKIMEFVQRGNSDIIAPMLKGILGRVDVFGSGYSPKSSPSTIRARFNSEGPNQTRCSFDTDDEINNITMRSVDGLDTSAIDANTIICQDSIVQENSIDNDLSNNVAEMLVPCEGVLKAAAQFSQTDRISLLSCRIGDNVLSYFNEKFNAFVVYLNNKNVHFLHTDCLKTFGVSNSSSLASSSPAVQAFIANVIEKEFCVARRSHNRYRVPQGFHFYRVRVKILEVVDLTSFSSNSL